MKYITSTDNNVIKSLVKLKQKKYREKQCEYIIEGIKMIREAIKAQEKLKALFILEEKQETFKEILENLSFHVPIYLFSDRVFKKVTTVENSEGILAVNKYSHRKPLKEGYTLFLDRVQDPGNMGTIIRTADAAGFLNIILSHACVDIYNEKVIRSTMGSIFHVNIAKDVNILEAIDEYKSKGYYIIGTDLKSDIYYNTIIKQKKIALVIGNEAGGIAEEVLALCDKRVKIPIYGNAESLNASIAAGIMMYEMRSEN